MKNEKYESPMKSKSEIITTDPIPTIFLVKMDKSAMTFELTVYAREFQHNSVIKDFLNTRIIEEFRKDGIIIT